MSELQPFQSPALQEQPRRNRAPVIPLKEDASILNWLIASGRLIPRDDAESEEEEREEEIADLIVGEENFEDSDDSDDSADE